MQRETRAYKCLNMNQVGRTPTPCCFLLFLLLVVIPISISIVDTLLVVKHACMHMRWHESNGQDSTPCCFLLFLPLVVISTSISILDIWLWLNMHACMHMRWHKSNGQATNPLLFPAVSATGGNININQQSWYMAVVNHACMHMR